MAAKKAAKKKPEDVLANLKAREVRLRKKLGASPEAGRARVLRKRLKRAQRRRRLLTPSAAPAKAES